jgi:hypothetical protein
VKSFLKVKIKSLAAEAAIIRREERRCLGAARWANPRQDPAADDLFSEYAGLHNHRVHQVEAHPVKTAPMPVRVQAANLAVKYGAPSKDAVLAWFAA